VHKRPSTLDTYEYHDGKRRYREGDRWVARKNRTTGVWYAQPATAYVYIDRDCTTRRIEFDSWRRAFDFAFFKAGEEGRS
jgi:hypothetical protein